MERTDKKNLKLNAELLQGIERMSMIGFQREHRGCPTRLELKTKGV